MVRVAVASHVTLIDGKQYDGIGNTLKATLATVAGEYVFVRNSMDGLLGSEVQYYKQSNIVKTIKLGVARRPAPFRYISEYLKTVQYFSKQEQTGVYIGIDPLNALAAIRLKKKGKVKKAIFFTADYSPKRFNNSILNAAYHWIDRYCVLHADEVWSVSTRICAIRRNMGLPDNRNIFVPNVPPLEFTRFAHNVRDRHQLVTTGIIDKQLDFEGIMQAISDLKNELPELKLTIIGNGPQEGSLKKLATKLGIKNQVTFTGRVPLEDALELQSKAGIGLALYTGVWGFNKYGDSTKCREYFNFGLPVISTDTHSTVNEIKESGAGVIVSRDRRDYVRAIRTILNDYDKYATASIKAGKQYRGVHARELKRLLTNMQEELTNARTKR